MAQHDYVIANGTGAAVRSDLNNALAAIVTQNSGATEPATMYAYQWWADTTTGLLKLRNGANNAWITLRELDGTLTIEDGTAGAPGLAFADDLNTGVFSPGADQVAFTAGGTARLTATTTGITSALPVDVPLGSASAPTVTFTGDLNTGIYSPGADQVAISTGGTGRLFVSSAGLVGIGTSTATLGGNSFRLAVVGTKTYSELIPRDGLAIADNTATAQGVGGSITLHGIYDGSGNYTAFGGIEGQKENGTSGNYAGALVLKSRTFLGNLNEAIRIDSQQRVGIGTTSPFGTLHLKHATDANIFFRNSTAAGLATGTLVDCFNDAASTATPLFARASQFVFGADSGGTFVERARIDSSGNFGIGTSTPVARLHVQNGVDTTFPNLPQNLTLMNTGAVAAGLGAGINFSANYSGGATTTYAAISGIKENATPGNAAGALTFGTRDAAGSVNMERMRITSTGAVTSKTTNIASAVGAGWTLDPSGSGIFTNNGNEVLYLNRETSDGTIVAIRQDNAQEGSISVSGTTVSYNGAHLSRWSQIPGIDPHDKDQRPEILRGTVMSNLDEMCDWIDPETDEPQANEQLNKTKISDVEGDKNVAGIFQSWDDDDDTWVNDYYLAMTGDFIIRIAEGVTVERGDLLMSAGDGTAKPQDDDIIRSKTIAKVTSTNVSCTYDDGSYCVPCVLMAC